MTLNRITNIHEINNGLINDSNTPNQFSVNSRYTDVDEYLCQRILTSDMSGDMDWMVEISAAHKVRVIIHLL